jgi:hypothetical protein
VTGTANQAGGPVVNITSPSNGSIFTAGSNITLTATASDGNDSIAQVSFYNNGSNFLGSSTTPPYTNTVLNVQQGSYIINAVATDTNGISTTSAPLQVTVTGSANQAGGPVVVLTSPDSGTTFTAGSNVTLTAAASENNGSITQVDFYYNGSSYLGTSTTSPYSNTVINVRPGNYNLTAVATDANGVKTTSAPIPVKVRYHVSQQSDNH